MSADLTVPPRLIEELERGAIDCVNLHYPGWGNTMGAAAVAIASLQARLDAAERDAARYRWLLKSPERQRELCLLVRNYWSPAYTASHVDAAIDIAATQEGKA